MSKRIVITFSFNSYHYNSNCKVNDIDCYFEMPCSASYNNNYRDMISSIFINAKQSHFVKRRVFRN